MPIIHIKNARTGEEGYQARADWQTPAGASRYFSVKKHGPRKAKRLAIEAEKELTRSAIAANLKKEAK